MSIGITALELKERRFSTKKRDTGSGTHRDQGPGAGFEAPWDHWNTNTLVTNTTAIRDTQDGFSEGPNLQSDGASVYSSTLDSGGGRTTKLRGQPGGPRTKI